MISETDLILNKDGSIYHLGLLPEQICDNIILVGDPDRVGMFQNKLDRVFYTNHVREFRTLMGEYQGKEVLIISTGIGTDNIDIVLNELDALANINFETKTINKKKRKLNFVRIGTSGSIIEGIDVDTFLASTHGIGLDVLMQFYERALSDEMKEIQLGIDKILKKSKINTSAYITKADGSLLKKVDKSFHKGMTVTLPGFYGPQGRVLRANPKATFLLDSLSQFTSGKNVITNLEMETAGIYGMAEILGHKAISLNAILANRITKKFSKNPAKVVDHLIDYGLEFLKTL
jgi:uridine phosphorylase